MAEPGQERLYGQVAESGRSMVLWTLSGPTNSPKAARRRKERGRCTHWFGYIATSDRKTAEAVERSIPQTTLLRANEVRR